MPVELHYFKLAPKCFKTLLTGTEKIAFLFFLQLLIVFKYVKTYFNQIISILNFILGDHNPTL